MNWSNCAMRDVCASTVHVVRGVERMLQLQVPRRAERVTPNESRTWGPLSAAEYVLLADDGSVHGVLATADIIRAMRNR